MQFYPHTYSLFIFQNLHIFKVLGVHTIERTKGWSSVQRSSVNKFGNILSIHFSDRLTHTHTQMVKVSGGFSSLTHPKAPSLLIHKINPQNNVLHKLFRLVQWFCENSICASCIRVANKLPVTLNMSRENRTTAAATLLLQSTNYFSSTKYPKAGI